MGNISGLISSLAVAGLAAMAATATAATGIDTSQSIIIKAPAEEVWRALTTPELRKQWFFGVDTTTDWKAGSPIVHKGELNGKPYEDKGMIVKIRPPVLLVHTHWSKVSGLPDSPENYQEVTYALAEQDGVTELTVSETNLPSEEAKAVSDKAWQMALAELKKLVE